MKEPPDATERRARTIPRCVYCGAPIDNGRACLVHRDLARRDPHYARVTRTSTGPPEKLRLDDGPKAS